MNRLQRALVNVTAGIAVGVGFYEGEHYSLEALNYSAAEMAQPGVVIEEVTIASMSLLAGCGAAEDLQKKLERRQQRVTDVAQVAAKAALSNQEVAEIRARYQNDSPR